MMRNDMNFLKLKSLLQSHNSYNKDKPSNLFQIILLIEDSNI